MRADEARHPVLRARYSDLVWDLKRVATGKHPDFRLAHPAIDSYLEALGQRLYREAIHGISRAKQALNLSPQIAPTIIKTG
jgi:hypothetical protein